LGSPEHRSDLEITWHILKPSELPAPDPSQLRAPTEFRVQKFAENIGNARILAIGQNGNVYVSRREPPGFLRRSRAISSALASSKAAVVEAVVDPDEPPARPEEVRA
jgi:hypothetical protein